MTFLFSSPFRYSLVRVKEKNEKRKIKEQTGKNKRRKRKRGSEKNKLDKTNIVLKKEKSSGKTEETSTSSVGECDAIVCTRFYWRGVMIRGM